MAPTNYPYLDLTVLPEIRPHMITSREVLLFDDGFSTESNLAGYLHIRRRTDKSAITKQVVK